MGSELLSEIPERRLPVVIILNIIAQDIICSPENKDPRPTTPKSDTNVSMYPKPTKMGNIIILTTKPGQNTPIAYISLLRRS